MSYKLNSYQISGQRMNFAGGSPTVDGVGLYVIVDLTGCDKDDVCTHISLELDASGIETSEMYDDLGGLIAATIVNGCIHITPEPGTISLLLLGAVGLVARRRRK